MRLKDLKDIKRLKLIEGSVAEASTLPYQLTHFCERDDIQFAIDQMNKYPAAWQLRKRNDDKFAIFINRPLNMEV